MSGHRLDITLRLEFISFSPMLNLYFNYSESEPFGKFMSKKIARWTHIASWPVKVENFPHLCSILLFYREQLAHWSKEKGILWIDDNLWFPNRFVDGRVITDPEMYELVLPHLHRIKALAGEPLRQLWSAILEVGNLFNKEVREREEMKKRTEYKVVIDFAQLAKRFGDKGLMLQVIECPYCGGKIDVPQAGNFVQCKYCGKSVYAIDIFEKFKGILGV